MDKKTLELRRKCITGTDIAAICGLSKWSSPLNVFLDKKGLTEPIAENKYMEWGKRLERIIAEKYAEDNGVELVPGIFILDGIFGGTPDFYAGGKLIEIKTTSYRNSQEWGEEGSDQIPEYYMTQVQWYLGLTKLTEAVVCVLIGGNDYRCYNISRNDRLIEILRSKASDFWQNYVVANNPPAATCAIDNKNLGILYSHHTDDIVVADYLLDDAIRLAKLKRKIKELSEELEESENRFKQYINDRAGVRGEAWKALWKKTSEYKKINWEKVAAEANVAPELIAKHTTVTKGVRRFIFTSSFEGI